MWILFAILIFIIAFFFVKREEHKKEQRNRAKEQAQSKAMQTHSVVTDVVHNQEEEEPVNHDDMQETRPENLDTEENMTSSPSSETFADETEHEEVSAFSTQLSDLKNQFEMSLEWQLFGSDAALLWHKDNPIVTILCLSKFNKGEANSLIYKDYHFNLESWSWHGASPKGAATEVKKRLAEQFRNSV